MHLQAIDAPPSSLQSQLAHGSIGVAAIDASGKVVDCNPAFASQLGDRLATLKPHSEADLTRALSQPAPTTLVLETLDDATIVVQIDQLQHNLRIVSSNFAVAPLKLPVEHDSAEFSEAQLLARIETWLAQTKQAPARVQACASVLCIGFDGIDQIRETVGRTASNKLWALIIARIEKTIPHSVNIARLPASEAAVFIADIDLPGTHHHEICTQLLDVLERPYFLAGRQVQLRAHIGVNDDILTQTSAESVMRGAALARRDASTKAASGIVRFSPELERAAAEQLELEVAVGRALWMNELQVVYQPLVDLRKHEVLGFEALLRWHSASHGSLSPTKFIPIAEKTGAILGMGEYVLHEACARVQQLAPDLQLSVNVSPVQLESDNFRQTVTDALNATGFAPERLTLEVTEGILVDASTRALDRLEQLREIGIKVAIDDFGTGYSSLAYLLRFPVDVLKIDRSFLLGEPDPRSKALVDCIVGLATELGFGCVAEGVETSDQYQRLCRIGCDVAQGFLLGRPLPYEQVRGYLSSAPRKLVEIC